MLVVVILIMASVGSWMVGSGTLSTRTSRLPCHATAFISPYLRDRVYQLCLRAHRMRWHLYTQDGPSTLPPFRRLPRLVGALDRISTGRNDVFGGAWYWGESSNQRSTSAVRGIAFRTPGQIRRSPTQGRYTLRAIFRPRSVGTY